jgi:hypothetical protein
MGQGKNKNSASRLDRFLLFSAKPKWLAYPCSSELSVVSFLMTAPHLWAAEKFCKFRKFCLKIYPCSGFLLSDRPDAETGNRIAAFQPSIKKSPTLLHLMRQLSGIIRGSSSNFKTKIHQCQ